MNSKTFQNQTWMSFIEKYNMHPQYGYLIPCDYEITSFKSQNLKEIMKSLPHLETLYQLNKLPEIDLEEKKSNFNDMMIIHDVINCLVNKYLLIAKKQGVQKLSLPVQIGVPLYKSSQYLKMKVGTSANMVFNWVPLNDVFINDPDSFGFEDFDLRYYMTKDKKNEKLFFGGSIIASFHLIKALRHLYEISRIIEEDTLNQKAVCDKMDIIAKIWDKITLENSEIVNHFDASYFKNSLRPLVAGFNDLYFEGVDKNISTSGGTAGSDPSFITFQHAMGINLEKSNESAYKNMRTEILKAISQDHRNLIQFMKGSKIRQYCHCSKKLGEKYNMVLNKYRDFLRLHSVFIENFILKQMPQNQRQNAKGVAGSTIITMINKHKDFECYKILEEKFVLQEEKQ